MTPQWNPITTALVVTNDNLTRSNTAPKARPAATAGGMRRCAMVCAKFQSVLGSTINAEATLALNKTAETTKAGTAQQRIILAKVELNCFIIAAGLFGGH
jgi:hypothetical protein